MHIVRVLTHTVCQSGFLVATEADWKIKEQRSLLKDIESSTEALKRLDNQDQTARNDAPKQVTEQA